MKTILITGSNGLLGQKLVDLLHAEPTVKLIASSRGQNKLAQIYPQVAFAAMDVTNAGQVEQVIAETQPTHLIHTAAMTNVDDCESQREECWKQNVDAVENLVKACEKHGVHLIHVSTDFIFDGENGPYSEEAEGKPVNFYGESKLAAEELVKRAACKWAILRTVLVFGIVHDYGRSNIVLWVKGSLEQGKQIKVVNDQLRTPTLAEDLAQGCWLAAKHDAQGIFNISGEELLTPHQMAVQVAEYFNLDQSLIEEVDGTLFTQPAKRPPRTGFDITKAKTQLGYQPHTFKESIAIVAGQI
ncbi:SDR family oxidoreductase [Rufibacter quisquiliarum]|uniref:dTDP-4-dehydrorhamnose reductase n=1 Tax=Rufibacter quisquiliarum TaxID=1549639 RepID=A0A839GPQ4_9BACT|nr:SDR family oxidoreductase [Rufibacter quisquiliarum]MBA9076877.1 dTDP-4-dehydrorhamnose reductase [Rufibacter quisquiliarum]